MRLAILCIVAPKPGDSIWGQVFDQGDWALVIVDAETWKIERVNRGYARMHGYLPEELEGRPVGDTLALEAHFLSPYHKKVLREGGRHVFESIHRRKDGSVFPVLTDVTGVRDDRGEILSYASSVYDISIRKGGIDEDIRENEQYYRMMAEAAPQTMWGTDENGVLNYLSQQWYQYTGVDPKVGVSLDVINSAVHPDQRETIQELWKKSLEYGKPFDFQFLLRRKDGSYSWQLARAVPIRDARGKIVRWFGLNTDIDEHKRTLERLEQEQEIRDKLVSTLAHDLRNPLAAAKASAELLVRNPDRLEVRQRLLDKILSNIERVEQMIFDLLDASRVKAGKTIPINLCWCSLEREVVLCIEEMNMIHGKRVVLEGLDTLVGAEGELYGYWSCRDLRRVLENLLDNAIKYGKTDTPITVRVFRKGNVAGFSVHNFGREITPEEQTHLFEYFRRSKGSINSGQRGWGVGLTLVRGIIDAHGGNVRVDSSPDLGTTFCVEIPVQPGSEKLSGKAA